MLLEIIQDDLKQAQLGRDELKVSTLRLLISEINYAKISKGSDLTDQDIISLVQREIKKRKESASAFRSGQREQQAEKEEQEAKILEDYLPEQISDDQLAGIIGLSMETTGASSMQDFGKVMGQVMSQVGQTASSQRVSEMIKQKLSGVNEV
ncbi:MAG: GatB/YqeY domain-containing protein [Patescibacteria group bacterium]|nr:GatB/YqeY domain-containing protein [Patescibacteria group bacterium]